MLGTIIAGAVLGIGILALIVTGTLGTATDYLMDQLERVSSYPPSGGGRQSILNYEPAHCYPQNMAYRYDRTEPPQARNIAVLAPDTIKAAGETLNLVGIQPIPGREEWAMAIMEELIAGHPVTIYRLNQTDGARELVVLGLGETRRSLNAELVHANAARYNERHGLDLCMRRLRHDANNVERYEGIRSLPYSRLNPKLHPRN